MYSHFKYMYKLYTLNHTKITNVASDKKLKLNPIYPVLIFP